MKDVVEKKEVKLTIIGISHKNKIIYNIVDNEGNFEYTGISIIKWLRNNKNMFISKMYEAQSYISIKFIFDDRIILNNEKLINNTNETTYNKIVALLEDNNNLVKNVYIFNTDEDLLVFNTEDTGSKFLAIDYKSLDDINSFMKKNFKRQLSIDV